MKTLTQETRSETIFRHTAKMLHEKRCSMETFGQKVVELYHRLIPAEARTVKFKVDGDIFRCATTNAQHLKRYMTPDVNVRIPVDLEEAWVLALEQPYQGECVRDLAYRYGLLDVPLPGSAAINDMQSVSRLTREVGEALEAISPMLHDGCFDKRDLPYAENAMRQVEDVIAAGQGLLARLRQLREA